MDEIEGIYRWVIMSEVEKLIFESPDFKFGIAYDNYVKCFEGATDNEEKSRLNEVVSKLHEGKISYPEFYENLNQSDEQHKRFHRMKLSSTRKRAYRSQERKVDRIKRHK
jgi:hypothetical protein